MPVTAKLSRLFYERLGDEVVNELVDWLNSVDATYHNSLRELNEINFARFDAKTEQRIADLGARIEQRIAAVESQLGARVSRIDARLDGLATREQLSTSIAASESRMLRWIVALWSSSILATLGLIVAILRAS